MAKIAVVAANGKASRKIISEALSRGFDVTAFGRHEENNTEAKTYVRKDILDLTREDLAGFDAVVSGFGAFTPETFPLYQTTTEHLADILAGSDTRLLFVGGAGSLYTNPERTETLADGKDFDPPARPGYEEVAWLPPYEKRCPLDLYQPGRSLPRGRPPHGIL